MNPMHSGKDHRSAVNEIPATSPPLVALSCLSLPRVLSFRATALIFGLSCSALCYRLSPEMPGCYAHEFVDQWKYPYTVVTHAEVFHSYGCVHGGNRKTDLVALAIREEDCGTRPPDRRR